MTADCRCRNRWHDVEVADERDRLGARTKRPRVLDQALEPRELVVEFRTRLGVAIRKVEARHAQAVHLRLEVAALLVRGVARKAAADLDRVGATREDGDAVPGPLPVPERTVARALELRGGKRRIDPLELLQAGDVGRLALEPNQKMRQALA